eukprot:scaffold121934_cov66-Phaeocystis_antarctica.AAC.7
MHAHSEANLADLSVRAGRAPPCRLGVARCSGQPRQVSASEMHESVTQPLAGHPHSRDTVSPCQAPCTAAPNAAFATPACTRDCIAVRPKLRALSAFSRTPRVPQTPKHRSYDETKRHPSAQAPHRLLHAEQRRRRNSDHRGAARGHGEAP